MTLAILARDPDTGNFGVAVTTSTAGSGGLDGVGHVPRFGICLGISVSGRCQKVGAAMLQAGLGADAVMNAMVGADSGAAWRQLAVVDSTGAVAGHTGAECVNHAAHRVGPGYLVMGNWLAGPAVIDGLERGFRDSKGETFVRRLLAGLEGGRDAGGEISDALVSASVIAYGDREGAHLFNFREDLDENPVAKLVRIHDRVAPAMERIDLARTQPHTLWAGLPRPS